MKTHFLLIAAAALMLSTSCKKGVSFDYSPDDITFSYDTTLAPGNYSKTKSQKYDFAAIAGGFGVPVDKLSLLKAQSVQVDLATPGVTWSDFDSAEVRMSAAGLPEVRMAWKQPIPTSTSGTSLTLDVDKNLNIVQYGAKGEVLVTLKLKVKRALQPFTVKVKRAEVFPDIKTGLF